MMKLTRVKLLHPTYRVEVETTNELVSTFEEIDDRESDEESADDLGKNFKEIHSKWKN